jgi:hypothetical protein
VKKASSLLALWTLCSWAGAQAPAPLEVRWPEAKAIAWSGIPAGEPAGTTASFLYPAPNAGGLIAAVLTHSLLVSGTRESERQARQKAADQVLEPYQPAIDRLHAAQLTSALQAHWATEPPNPGGVRRVVHLQPHFRVSSDHRVIVLDARIRVQEADTPPDRMVADRIVQVVSTPREGEDPLAAWLDNDAQYFREEIVTMLTHGIDIALNVTSQPAVAVPARTQRYAYGNETRMERGQPLAAGCGRIVLWTLRESWMSVPVNPGDPAACVNRYQLSPP